MSATTPNRDLDRSLWELRNRINQMSGSVRARDAPNENHTPKSESAAAKPAAAPPVVPQLPSAQSSATARRARALESASAALIARVETSVRSMTPMVVRPRSVGSRGLASAQKPPPSSAVRKLWFATTYRRPSSFRVTAQRLAQIRAKWAHAPAEKIRRKYIALAAYEPTAPRFALYWTEQLAFEHRSRNIAAMYALWMLSHRWCVDVRCVTYMMLWMLASQFAAVFRVSRAARRAARLSPAAEAHPVSVARLPAPDAPHPALLAAAAADDDEDFLTTRMRAPSEPHAGDLGEDIFESELAALADRHSPAGSPHSSPLSSPRRHSNSAADSEAAVVRRVLASPISPARESSLPGYMRPRARWSGARATRVPLTNVDRAAAEDGKLSASFSDITAANEASEDATPVDETPAAVAAAAARSPRFLQRSGISGSPSRRRASARAASRQRTMDSLCTPCRVPLQPAMEEDVADGNGEGGTAAVKSSHARAKIAAAAAHSSTTASVPDSAEYGRYNTAEIHDHVVTPVRRSHRIRKQHSHLNEQQKQQKGSQQKRSHALTAPQEAAPVLRREEAVFQPNRYVSLGDLGLEAFLSDFLERRAIEMSMQPL